MILDRLDHEIRIGWQPRNDGVKTRPPGRGIIDLLPRMTFRDQFQSRASRFAIQLESGTRPSGPGGCYDGVYIENRQYVAGSGTLGPC